MGWEVDGENCGGKFEDRFMLRGSFEQWEIGLNERAEELEIRAVLDFIGVECLGFERRLCWAGGLCVV